jgi:hypothetical protein
LTLHARRRMKERLGVKSYKKAEILSEKAWAKECRFKKSPIFAEFISMARIGLMRIRRFFSFEIQSMFSAKTVA